MLTVLLPHTLYQCLCSIGHCLHLTAKQYSLDRGLQWEGELVAQLEDGDGWREGGMDGEREKEKESKEEGEESRETVTATVKTPHSALSSTTLKEESSKAQVI